MGEFDFTIKQIKEQLGFTPVFQYELYPDGSVKKDENGRAIPVYETNHDGSTRTDADGKPIKVIKEWHFINSTLIFAFNGTGKTRLSYEFAHQGRDNGRHHTLYYNAFTEDLFTWHNDLDSNTERYMVINTDSALIRGLAGYDYGDAVRRNLASYANFDVHFESNYHDEKGNLVVTGDNVPREVWFSRKRRVKAKNEDGSYRVDESGNQIYQDIEINNIKISRGEERLFIWCLFRYIVDLVISGDPNFRGVKYIYIDDPMSSLDDNNVMLFAYQLYSLINACHEKVIERYKVTNEQNDLGLPMFVISTHHNVFFNTMNNGLNGCYCLTLYKDQSPKSETGVRSYRMKEHTPAFYHLSMLALIKKEFDSIDKGNPPQLQRFHFNVMRGIVEQIAQVLGQSNKKNGPLGHVLDGIKFHYGDDIYSSEKEGFERLYKHALNILSHHNNTMTETNRLNDDNIQLLRDIYNHIVDTYHIEVPSMGK